MEKRVTKIRSHLTSDLFHSFFALEEFYLTFMLFRGSQRVDVPRFLRLPVLESSFSE